MKKILAALALTMGVFISFGAQSSTPPATGASGPPATITEHPCKKNFDQFCAGKVVCGKGACHDCLNEHMDKLDKACAAVMKKWDEKEEEKLSKEVLNSK